MIGLLARLFIKNHNNYSDPAVRRKYGFLTGFVGIIFNVIICMGKIVVGILSSSVSVIADGVNNLSDAGSSVITVVGFKIASKPVDEKHPYGHGRMEYVAALLVSLLIVVVGAELAISSIKKIIQPQNVFVTEATLVILSVSVLIKLYMFIYNYLWGKKLSSSVLKTTAYDSIGDAVSTFVVLVCAIVSYFISIPVLDGCAGAAVALFIIITGGRSVWDIISELLGKPPQKDFLEAIESFIKNFDYVMGVHDIIVHDYGQGKKMVSLHVEISAETDLLTAHDYIDEIENKMEKEFGCQVIIHADPVLQDPESNNLRKEVLKIVKGISYDLSIHDFQVHTDGDKKAISFDVLAPFAVKETEEELNYLIVEKLHNLLPNYEINIHVDRPFV